ncbi:rhomboid family intramembrane serine protease [Ekhidna sp.]|uniref:rhomboid family intramembrane serine protease n=1 Tax=Ekhidna sp. TaxID=2608089 RepID=UPI0032ECDCF1
MHKSGIVPPLRLCFFMWLVFTVEFYLKVDLGYLGIYPREVSGLIGIVMAPLLHGNFNHLASNTIPLLVLGGTLFFFFPRIAQRVFLQAYFFTNLLVWIFGRPFFHIGASGLIYALASFLVFFGLFNRNFKSVIISASVIFLYGGMAYGLLSFDDRVSWESHLMGAVVGLVTAMLLRNK